MCYNASEKTCLQGFSSAALQRAAVLRDAKRSSDRCGANFHSPAAYVIIQAKRYRFANDRKGGASAKREATKLPQKLVFAVFHVIIQARNLV